MAQRPLQTSQEMETRLTTTTDPTGPLVLPGAHCFLPTPPLSMTEPQTPVLAQPLRAWVQCHLGEWCFVLHTHTHSLAGEPLAGHWMHMPGFSPVCALVTAWSPAPPPAEGNPSLDPSTDLTILLSSQIKQSASLKWIVLFNLQTDRHASRLQTM